MGASVAVAAALRRAEREIIEHLRERRATTPDRATALPELPPLGRRRLERLVSARVVHETPDGYWLDETTYADYRSDRRTLAFVMLGIAATVLAGVLLAKAL